MKNSSGISRVDFRTRLIAFLVVLAVGFFMGWLNGRNDASRNADGEAIGQTKDQETASEQGYTTVDETSDEQTTAEDEDTESPSSQVDTTSDDSGSTTVAPTRGPTVDEDGWYTSKDEVALYIHTYGRLPGNFISKTKARDRGWVASEGNLDEVCPGMSIGGSRYYNDDGELPDKRGRQWTECDINYHGGFRGPERIVFSSDGLIYYTADHYETFERLY